MFLILSPSDEPQIPPAPPAHVASYDRATPAPLQRRRTEIVIDDAAVDRVVALILGESPHSAYNVRGNPTCLTCKAAWPCQPTLALILSSARGGLAAVEAAEDDYLDGAL